MNRNLLRFAIDMSTDKCSESAVGYLPAREVQGLHVPRLIERLFKHTAVVLAEDAKAIQPGAFQRPQDFGFGEMALAMGLGLDLLCAFHLEGRFANRPRRLLA